MDAPHEVVTQRIMHGPVTGDPAHPLEARRPDAHVEMALPALAITAVSPVAFAIVHHLQLARFERLLQPVRDLCCY